jgi:hypothetical protein
VFVHHQLACMVLVACVVSKKFIKFLRKSLKEFDLNLKRKVVLKGV